MYKIMHISLFVSLLFIVGCSDESTENEMPVDPSSRNLFFAENTIRTSRNSTQALEAIINYAGPPITEDVRIGYQITSPTENAAVAGEDYIPQQNLEFLIPRNRASVQVRLLQRILSNPDAREARSLIFELNDVEGFTIGNGSGENSSLSITLEPSPSDPNDPQDFIGDKKFFFSQNGSNFKIPYFSNVDDITETNNSNITRAVVVLHGAGRNAGSSFRNMMEAASIESFPMENLLVVSPQFVLEEDIEEFVLDSEHLYWSTGWRSGNLSRDEPSNPRPERIASYTVMDSLLTTLAGYPNLENIVFTGHSAGGQFVHRYSASSPIADDIEAAGIGIRFIVNNPSSFVYMDDRRLVPGTESTFETPTNTTNCPEFNEYRYGLEDLVSYLENIGAETIRERLAQREVIYLNGAIDNDPNANLLDISCEAAFLGRNRLERGINYFNYLAFYYSDVFGIDINETQKMEIVPGVGHSNGDMYQSEIGRRYTFRNE